MDKITLTGDKPRITVRLTAACLLMAVLLVLCSCSVTSGSGTVTPLATTTPAVQTSQPTPEPTPVPSPSPTPTPTVEPTPTPTPVPTPTLDPWAGFFSDTPVIKVSNPYTLKGTYLYKDKTLSVSISILMKNNRENFVAEIYTREPNFFSGFANPKKPTATNKPWFIARTYKAVFGVSSDFWNFKRLTMMGQKEVRTQKGIIIRGGKILSEKQDNEIMAIMPDGELRIYEKNTVTAQQLLDLNVKDTYSFGPVLVKDGKVNPDMKNHVVYKHLNKANTRCSIGMVEPGHYFVVISRNITYDQLAQIHLELGSKFAYNLDGGNSAAMVFMGEQVNPKIFDASLKTGQRSIPDLILIGTSDQVPGLKDPVHGAANSR